jgi:hypothetical protein
MKINLLNFLFIISITLIIPAPVMSNVKSELKRLEQEIESIRQRVGVSADSRQLNLYGSFRPVFTLENNGNDTVLDVRDGLSRFGLAGGTQVLESSQVFFSGEWNVKLAEDGRIEGTRLAFVGIKGILGRLTLGKQRPPHYRLIAEHVDIFNHASSPYGYYNQGPFFVDNMTSYHYQLQGLTIQAAFRADGATGNDREDMINVGLGFNHKNLYVGVAYLSMVAPSTGVRGPNEEGDETESIALASYIHLDTLYLAAAYQGGSQSPEGGGDLDVATLDVSMAYALAHRYKIKAGLFIYDDGISGRGSNKNKGVNLTLEHRVADNVRIYGEYLVKYFDQRDLVNAISFGFSYDFDAEL